MSALLQVNDLQKRIKTFDFYNWPFTALKVSPYRCAIYGFSCVKPYELKCDVCSERISASEDLDLDDEEKMNQLAQKLMTQHTSDCFFRDLNKIDLPRMTTSFLFQYWNAYYNENLKSFEGQSIEYPVISPSVKNYVAKDYQDVLFSNEVSSHEGLIDAAIVLSIFGWRLHSAENAMLTEQQIEGQSLIACEMCGRKIHLPSYQTTKDKIQDLNSIPMEENTEANVSTFDVLQEHRWFCKWGRPPIPEKSKQYGWNICLEMLNYQSKKKPQAGDKASVDSKHGDAMAIETISPNEKISGELTRFKLEIVNSIQDLKNKKEQAQRLCEDVTQKVQGIGIIETAELKEKLRLQRQKLEELVEGLDINPFSTKKVKLAKNASVTSNFSQ